MKNRLNPFPKLEVPMSISFIGFTNSGEKLLRIGNEVYGESYGSDTLRKLQEEELRNEFSDIATPTCVTFFDPDFGTDYADLATDERGES